MKIHVTGNAGSGKSTLAREMAELLKIPVYSLDSLVWGEYWQKAPQKQRIRAELALAEKPDWIIEGVSEIALNSADYIVFLDYPRWLCFVRCALRNARYLFSSRPGLPDHCPEILIIPRLAQIIWRFPHKVKPVIEQQAGVKVLYRLTSNREVSAFVAALLQDKQTTSGHRSNPGLAEEDADGFSANQNNDQLTQNTEKMLATLEHHHG